MISCYGFHDEIRLKFMEEILEEQGFQVKKVFSDFDHLDKKKVSYEDSSIIEIQVPRYHKNISMKRLTSHMVFACRLKKVLKREKPELIIADIPPNAVGMSVASYKKKNKGCKVIFDVLDLWPESFPESKLLRLPFWFWKRMRTKALPQGDYVTLECNHYKEFLEGSLREGKTSTLYLCKPPMKERLQFNHQEEALSFCYLGSINNIINIFAIVEMLRMIRRKRKVKLYLIGDGERREFFLNQLKVNKIPVEYLGLVFDDEVKHDVFRRCHFGINMYKDNVVVGLTMKSLDYFRAGLPTINMNIVDTGILVKKYNAGINLAGDSWSKGIDELIELNPKEWNTMHKNTQRMFDELFSQAVFKEKFEKVLERCELKP